MGVTQGRRSSLWAEARDPRNRVVNPEHVDAGCRSVFVAPARPAWFGPRVLSWPSERRAPKKSDNVTSV